MSLIISMEQILMEWLGLSDSENNAITIVKQWLFTIMNSIMIVYDQYFSS